MRIFTSFARAGVLVAALAGLAVPTSTRADATDAPQTFTGVISDDMCGLDHSGMGEKDDKKCTLSCVESGSDFVLADREHKKVYKLDDQKKPKDFAGDKVVITGTLDGDTIHVQSIEAAKP